MTKKIPDYLKLHTEVDVDSKEPCAACPGSLDTLRQAFATATGWQLNYATDAGGSEHTAHRLTSSLETVSPRTAELVVEAPVTTGHLERQRAVILAEAIGQLVHELQEARDALWRREAELAAGIPVTLKSNESHQLAERLESVLRGGAEAIGCQAAALYMLDDATSYLKLRACWGLARMRLAAPPRPLRGAVSDLEALVGHAVALEDASILPHWKVPEDYPAALCVPVSSANTPLGTLWFFCHETREFTDEQTHLAEIIAGRLVADLEREVLANEQLQARHGAHALRVMSRFQDELAPSIPPLIDGWQVAGRTLRAEAIGGDFHDWFVLPDGRLAVIAGHAEGDAVDAALTCTLLQAALKAHADHRHNARQMLDHLSEALWIGSTGDRFASIWYGLIDPERGSLQFASAGDTGAVIRSIPKGRGETLTSDQPLLGSDPDHRYAASNRTIEVGESLILYTRGIRDSLDSMGRELDAQRLVAITETDDHSTAEEQIDAILHAVVDRAMVDRTVIVVRHIHD